MRPLAAIFLSAVLAAAASGRMTEENRPTEKAADAKAADTGRATRPFEILRSQLGDGAPHADFIALICAATGAGEGEWPRFREVLSDEIAFDCEHNVIFDPMCSGYDLLDADDESWRTLDQYGEPCLEDVEFAIKSIPQDGPPGALQGDFSVNFCVHFAKDVPDNMGGREYCFSLGVEAHPASGEGEAPGKHLLKLTDCDATCEGQNCSCTVCPKGCSCPIAVLSPFCD